MQLLVACQSMVATGGLLRFEKLGLVARELGHSMAYMVADDAAEPQFTSAFEVLGFDEAARRRWDCVLIPGAGFASTIIEGFRRLRAPQFGTRVQMVLNDRQVRSRFLAVNTSLRPDIVVFNNEDWPTGSFHDFYGKQFHHVIGAVDVHMFRPVMRSSADGRFVIGAQLQKNGEAVAGALRLLPERCIVRFFGMDRNALFVKLRGEYGRRIEYAGLLFGEDLADYYRNLDVMVSVESHAGWANVVAEAMASGVPVVTTRAGTLSIAIPDHTALVIDVGVPEQVASAISAILEDTESAKARARRARTLIETFDWRTYTLRLLDLIAKFDGTAHYIHAPKLGLHGKADPAERLLGLESLLADCAGATVLDAGAAEGWVGKEFAACGAALVRGYETDAARVQLGRHLWRTLGNFEMKRADLCSEADLAQIAVDAPAAGYDVTLYLGVHQHLPPDRAVAALRALLRITRGTIALRMPKVNWESAAEILIEEGFDEKYSKEPSLNSYASPLWVYSRR